MFTTACKLSLSYSIVHIVNDADHMVNIKDVFCGKHSRLGGDDSDDNT